MRKVRESREGYLEKHHPCYSRRSATTTMTTTNTTTNTTTTTTAAAAHSAYNPSHGCFHAPRIPAAAKAARTARGLTARRGPFGHPYALATPLLLHAQVSSWEHTILNESLNI